MRNFTVAKGVQVPALVLLMAFASATATDVVTRQKLQADREHYEKQLGAYREMRDKVERGHVSEAQWQAGQDIKEFGMQTLRELKWAGMMQGLTGAVHKELAPGEGKSPNPKLNDHWFIIVNSVGKGTSEAVKLREDYEKVQKALSELQRYQALPENQKHTKEKLDAAITAGEVLKTVLSRAGADKRLGFEKTKVLEQTTGGLLAGLHLAAGFAADNDADREKHFAKYTAGASAVLLKHALIKNAALVEAGAAGGVQSLGVYAALAQVCGELGARFSVAGFSHHIGSKLVREAELMKENTLSDLSYRIMV
ncbi:MAG: hypothetical protein Q8M07_14280, partial [Prosthecobacter sp.]|nr:hypothetical protein [Prosthecobacter sp.]